MRCGAGGTLVPSENPAALADAIEAAAKDRETLAARAAHAQARNRELFDVDRCAEIHEEIYNSLTRP